MASKRKGLKKNKRDYVYAVGRRRSASARVRLFRGKGESTVNGMTVSRYFPGIVYESVWTKPFKVADVLEKFYFTAKIVGGGKKGQLHALTHSIAKALDKESKDKYRKLLKDAGLLTRDPRVRERRKVGTGGRARRKKQSPKR